MTIPGKTTEGKASDPFRKHLQPSDVPRSALRAFLVCGSQYATDTDFLDVIHGALCELEIRNTDVFIHGAAKGVDTLADDFLTSSAPWPTVIPMPAQWEDQGRSAEPRRNCQMLAVVLALSECGYRPFCLAFPRKDSKGTRHMVRIWESASGLTYPRVYELDAAPAEPLELEP